MWINLLIGIRKLTVQFLRLFRKGGGGCTVLFPGNEVKFVFKHINKLVLRTHEARPTSGMQISARNVVRETAQSKTRFDWH